MYTLYKFHFLNGISEINQLFDDILIIWPVPVDISLSLLQSIFWCTVFLDIVVAKIIRTLVFSPAKNTF